MVLFYYVAFFTFGSQPRVWSCDGRCHVCSPPMLNVLGKKIYCYTNTCSQFYLICLSFTL